MAKVIFVNRFYYPDISATSQMLTDLAEGLAQRGMSVLVVTSRLRYDAENERLTANQCRQGVEITRVLTTRFGRKRLVGRAIDYLSFYVTCAIRLTRMTRRGDFVVAKTDPPLLSVICALVARLRRAHHVNWLQDIFPEIAVRLEVPGIRTIAPVLRWARDRSLASADANFVLGDGMRDFVRTRGVPDERIVVSPNWASSATGGSSLAETEELKAHWGLNGAFVIGYSGNMGRAHEFETIVSAIERLQERSDIRFLFVGDGARRPWLEAEIRRRKLPNCVLRPYQPRSALPVTLALPDLHLVSLAPALEGLLVPSKLYGILSAGKFVLNVGDEDGEIARTLARHDCGVTVRPGDDEKLASTIAHLSQEPDAVARAGARAHDAYVSEYTLTRALERWLTTFQRLDQTTRQS